MFNLPRTGNVVPEVWDWQVGVVEAGPLHTPREHGARVVEVLTNQRGLANPAGGDQVVRRVDPLASVLLLLAQTSLTATAGQQQRNTLVRNLFATRSNE